MHSLRAHPGHCTSYVFSSDEISSRSTGDHANTLQMRRRAHRQKQQTVMFTSSGLDGAKHLASNSYAVPRKHRSFGRGFGQFQDTPLVFLAPFSCEHFSRQRFA